MNTSIALSHSTVSSFDKDLHDITVYWQRITAPLELSVRTFHSIKDSYVNLVASHKRALDKLDDINLMLNSIMFSTNSTVDSNTYSFLRHLDDVLKEYDTLCVEMKDDHRKLMSLSRGWLFFVYMLSSHEHQKTRKKLSKAIKRQSQKVDAILSKVEVNIATSPSKFVTLDADKLWQDRCKAYDYFL